MQATKQVLKQIEPDLPGPTDGEQRVQIQNALFGWNKRVLILSGNEVDKARVVAAWENQCCLSFSVSSG